MVVRYLPFNLTKDERGIVGNQINYPLIKLVMDENYNLVTNAGTKVIANSKLYTVDDQYSTLFIKNETGSALTYTLPRNPENNLSIDFFIEDAGAGFQINPNGKDINGSTATYESELIQYQSMKLIYNNLLDGWRVIKIV